MSIVNVSDGTQTLSAPTGDKKRVTATDHQEKIKALMQLLNNYFLPLVYKDHISFHTWKKKPFASNKNGYLLLGDGRLR